MLQMLEKVKSVEDWLNEVDYDFTGYIPSEASLKFFNFIKLVNGADGEENLTPVVHYKLMDNIFDPDERQLAILCHRGFAKTTILSEYLPLYCAVYGELPGFGDLTYMLFISDTMENGCRNMRQNMQNRWNQSEFLQKYLPTARFTDAIIEFKNLNNKPFAIRLAGAQQSIRGTRYLNKRPELCVMDDLLSDQDAKSPTCVANVNNTIHRGVAKAMHPTRNKKIYVGTVFNASDPLYNVIESGRWSPSVYPVCEKFPCTEEEFRGSWEDRFPFSAVLDMYQDDLSLGRIASFNGEMMNRVTSEEDRLLNDHDVKWYPRKSLLDNRQAYNFYITTDFATSAKQEADYSVISVWAVNSTGHWFLVDGMCKRQGMGENVDALFKFAQEYKPQSVGVEVSGQQGGFIPWIEREMLTKNCWFSLASENNSKLPGIRPVTHMNKLGRFQTIVPWFKQGKMHFPQEWRSSHALMIEAENEMTMVTRGGFKSKNDDWSDTASMLSVMPVWLPSGELPQSKDDNGNDIWDFDEPEDEYTNSYIV